MEKATHSPKTKRTHKRPYEKPRVKVIAVEAYDVLGTCNQLIVGTCGQTQI